MNKPIIKNLGKIKFIHHLSMCICSLIILGPFLKFLLSTSSHDLNWEWKHSGLIYRFLIFLLFSIIFILNSLSLILINLEKKTRYSSIINLISLGSIILGYVGFLILLIIFVSIVILTIIGVDKAFGLY